MTTHFEAMWKDGRFGTVKTGQCAKWAMTQKYMVTTTDKTKVDCTRCAKQLGIVPAPKAPPKNPTGTCQCCFGGYKVPKTTIALHGYERPGYGYIVGRCRGEGKLPYEHSCEATKTWRDELIGVYNHTQSYLTSLKEGKVTELQHVKTDWDKPYDRNTGRRPTITVTIKVGDKYISSGRESLPSFEDVLNREVSKTEQQVKGLSQDIEFLRTKIIDWKYTELVRKA